MIHSKHRVAPESMTSHIDWCGVVGGESPGLPVQAPAVPVTRATSHCFGWDFHSHFLFTQGQD